VADSANSVIRKLTPALSNWVLITIAGSVGGADGTASTAQFSLPKDVAVDSAGNLYVADTENCTIRKVSAGVVTTLAGLPGNQGSADGTGSKARFFYPDGVAVDSSNNVYVADSFNNAIRKVTPAGVVTTLAGLAQFDTNGFPVGGSTDGTNGTARFDGPNGVAVDTNGNIYVADQGNSTIRKLTPVGTNWVVTTLAGLAGSAGSADGTGSVARFSKTTGVAVDSAGNVYVADPGNFTIRKVTPAGVVTTLAGLAGSPGSADGTGPAARFGGVWSPGLPALAGGPSSVAVDSAGNVYVTDDYNSTIRKVTPAGTVTTLAGLVGSAGSADGTGSAARFGGGWITLSMALGVTADSMGNIYVADTWNNTIRKGYPALTIVPAGLNFGSNEAQFSFSLTGPVGQSVVVEASSDLLHWLPIWTNTLEGPLNFKDPQSGGYSSRFYRARSQ
jgi:sugar lactone lactonase YvrE